MRLSARTHLLYLTICVIYFLFFRGHRMFVVSGHFDDICYVEWLYRFLHIPFPLKCYADFYLPGLGLFWMPAGLLGWFVSWITGQSVHDWIPAFIGVTSFLCWGGALVLIDRIIRQYTTGPAFPSPSVFWPVTFLLNVPVLYYATMRPTMAHATEILLVTACFYFLIKRAYLVTFLLAGWLILVRINDAPILGVIVGRLIDKYWSKTGERPEREKRWLIAGAVLVVIASVPLLRLAFVTGYGGVDFLIPILKEITPGEVHRTLIGERESLVWTAPWWLFTLLIGVRYIYRLSWMARAGLAWMWLILLVCMGWTSAGGNFLYRYTIGTHVAALIIWLEVAPYLAEKVRRIARGALLWGAAYTTYITWIYGTRFSETTIWGAVLSGSPVMVLRSLFEPFLVFALTPICLAFHSWFPDVIVRLGWLKPPNYVVSGPALIMLTLLNVVFLVLGILLLRRLLIRRREDKGHIAGR